MNANDQLKPAQAAVFCLGIGDDYGTSWVASLNYPLLRGIARQNDGFDARIKQSETEAILSEYYDILSSPVLSFISLDYTNAFSLTRHRFRGLYSGTDIVIAGKFADASVEVLGVSLFAYTVGQAVQKTLNVDIDWSNSGDGNGYVAERIWAYLKLLSYANVLDNPVLEVVLQRQERTGALALALEHDLVTPWTSMIAVAYRGNDSVNDTENTEDDTNQGMDEMDSDVDMNTMYTLGTPGGGVTVRGPSAPGTQMDDDTGGDMGEEGDDDDETNDDRPHGGIMMGSDDGGPHSGIYIVVIVIGGIGLLVAVTSCIVQQKKSAQVSFSATAADEDAIVEQKEQEQIELAGTPITPSENTGKDRLESLLP
eukprot:192955_1